MKKILIIGISSCIGSNLARMLRDRHQVYGTYSKQKCSIDGIPTLQLTIHPEAPIEEFINLIRPEVVIYSVAQSNFLQCEADPVSTEFLHTEAPSRMASALARYRGQFIYLSSSKVFSGTKGRYTETHETDPNSVYGITKLRAEKTLEGISNSVVLRLGTIFGMGSPNQSSMLNRILSGLWARDRKLELVCDEYRTFTCVSEVARAIEACMEHPNKGGVYHVGNSERNSYYSFAAKVAEALALPADHLVPVKGAQYANQRSRQSLRGSDLSLVADQFTHMFKIRFRETEQCLAQLARCLREGLQ